MRLWPRTLSFLSFIRLLNASLRYVGHSRAIEDLGHEDVAEFLAAPLARTRPDGGRKKATSENALRSSLRGFFRYLHRAGYIARDPTRLLRQAVCGTPPPDSLTDGDQERLLFTLANAEGPEGRRDSAMFHLMLASGLRVGSVVALDVEDVDLERGEVAVRKATDPSGSFSGEGDELTRHNQRSFRKATRQVQSVTRA